MELGTWSVKISMRKLITLILKVLAADWQGSGAGCHRDSDGGHCLFLFVRTSFSAKFVKTFCILSVMIATMVLQPTFSLAG